MIYSAPCHERGAKKLKMEDFMNTIEKKSAGQSAAQECGIEVVPAVADGAVKVSVIMPIYNADRFLALAIGSVLKQTLKEIEVICVDDGSTDKSLNIIREMQKADERIRIVTETNAGPALARNNGIRRARGEFIAFLDADDFFEPTLLERLYLEATKCDLDITLAEYDIYNTRKEVFEKVIPSEHEDIYKPGEVTSKSEHPDHIFLSTNGAAWNKLFRRSFVTDKNLQFLPDVKLYEDVYFVVCALSLAQRIGKVSGILIHHRLHSEQSRARTFRKYYSQVPMIYAKIKEFLMQHGMYAPLSSSFLNMTASRCYKIFSLLSAGEQEKFWNLLNAEYADALDWVEKGTEDFEDVDVFDFVANVEMYDYDQYKKRCAKGLSLRLDRIAPMQKAVSTKKKARTLIGKVFTKKK